MRRILLFFSLLTLPSLLFAHPGEGASVAHNFLHGLLHPLTGWDHLLAMLAVGFWAAQLGGRATWAVPLSFVGLVALGFYMATLNINLPWTSVLAAASVFVLGFLIVRRVNLPLFFSVLLVGAFGIIHGYDHAGAGMMNDGYVLGFLSTTLLLHGLGILLAICFYARINPVSQSS